MCPDLAQTIRTLASCNIAADEEEQPFLERFQEAIQTKLDTDGKVKLFKFES